MKILAIVIYVILSIIIDPLWPIDLIGGKAGCIGQVIVIVWVMLFIAGMAS